MTIKYGFTIIYSYFLIVSLLASTLPFIAPFDPRQYRIAFYRTWTDSFRSVTLFWGQGWHAFLRRPFQVIGGDPTTWIVRELGGSERLASDLSVLVIFGVSAWLHEEGASLTVSGLPADLRRSVAGSHLLVNGRNPNSRIARDISPPVGSHNLLLAPGRRHSPRASVHAHHRSEGRRPFRQSVDVLLARGDWIFHCGENLVGQLSAWVGVG